MHESGHEPGAAWHGLHEPGCNARECMSWYAEFGARCERVSEAEWFKSAMLGTVIVASLLVGVQVGYGLDSDPVLSVCDLVILVIFALECVVKIFANPFAPWTYFVNEDRYWNWFDFLIVVLSMPGVLWWLEGNSG